MQTIRLRINDKIYKHLMWFLKRFDKEELQIIEENEEYLSVQEYLQKELDSVEEGKAKYMTIDELDQDLESTIREHED